jgi:hypothetical protein
VGGISTTCRRASLKTLRQHIRNFEKMTDQNGNLSIVVADNYRTPFSQYQKELTMEVL